MTGNVFEKAARKLALTVPFIALVLGAGMLVSSIHGVTGGEDAVSASATPGEERRYTVVIDAGHGGEDGGAVGVAGTIEAELNLKYALALKAELERLGVTAVMTRESEDALARGKKADMAARREIMNGSGADAVVSVHMNKFRDPSVSGPMAFYMAGSEEGEKLASDVISAVCESLGRNSRLANPGDYYVIRRSEPPAVIIECGFLSNAAEEQLLLTDDHMAKLVSGVAGGVTGYLKRLP